MKEKDKQLIKDTALVIADQIVSNIPALNIAWGLSKALYGSGIKMREQKALEWVEMVRDNPDVFIKDLLVQSDFQDGFVYSLEKYLTERNQARRYVFRQIFLGYSVSEDRDLFPLEKFFHTLSQLTDEDIRVLKDIDISRKDRNYQIYGNEERNLTNIYNLINLGILHTDPSSRLGAMNSPFVWISEFGVEFIKYLKL